MIKIREFCIEKFEEASNISNIWKLANRTKGTRRYANSPIHERGGVDTKQWARPQL